MKYENLESPAKVVGAVLGTILGLFTALQVLTLVLGF